MAKYFDFLTDPVTGDLLIKNGQPVFGDSIQQEVTCIVSAYVGSYRMSPLLGVGMEKFKNSVGRETEVERLISLNLRQDGIETTQLKVEAGLVTKIAPYRL
ncbi:MAG TPA: hypothetical protein VK404_01875 [Spirosoma sp.]|nr:hypothetical protein [Spirosoma sp.]